MPRLLGEILADIPIVAQGDRRLESNTSVDSITSDPGRSKPGTVFIATHPQAYLHFSDRPRAFQASVIFGERPPPAGIQIPYLQVQDCLWTQARLAANFYHHPSKDLKVIGVTGTSGKTTTTFLIEAILKASGAKVGVIGTVNFRYGDQVFDATHTTQKLSNFRGFWP